MTEVPEDRSRGLVYILAATAVAGVGGYAIQLLAPALLDDAHSYLAFSVFWSAIYLFVAAISGVQQEVTRATRPSDVPASRPTLRTFTFIAAAVIAMISIVVGFTLAPVAFTADPAAMTFWFGVGLVGYLLTAVLAGVMYGLSLWRAIAALIVADSLIRVILVLLGLFLHVPPAMLAVAISVPFVLAFGLVWIAVHRRLVGRFALDVGARRLSLNSLGTVAAAAATGVMVTGLPLLIRATMPDAPATLIASLILIITITRAPLIVPLMALQSFLIVDFRAAGPRIRPRLILFLGLAAAATVVGALLAAALGPWIAEAISAGRYTVSAGVAAAVVVSAGLVAMMCITGPALLSEGRHVPYVAGWLTAAGLTIGMLLPAVDPTLRVLGALIVPPAIGLVVHLASVRSFDPPDGGGDARGR